VERHSTSRARRLQSSRGRTVEGFSVSLNVSLDDVTSHRNLDIASPRSAFENCPSPQINSPIVSRRAERTFHDGTVIGRMIARCSGHDDCSGRRTSPIAGHPMNSSEVTCTRDLLRDPICTYL
jgi:hypothetical protein